MWTQIQSEKPWYLTCSTFSSDTCHASGVVCCTLALKQNDPSLVSSSQDMLWLFYQQAVYSQTKMKPILNGIRLQSWTSAVSKPDSRLVLDEGVL